MAQTQWFKRFRREVEGLSPYFRFVRIKYGFWRIFQKGIYMHEVYEEMPYIGYDIEDKDIRLISKKFWEEYEDRMEITRKVKNYVEGYKESLDRVKRRYYMLKNDKEYRETARRSYQVMHVK